MLVRRSSWLKRSYLAFLEQLSRACNQFNGTFTLSVRSLFCAVLAICAQHEFSVPGTVTVAAHRIVQLPHQSKIFIIAVTGRRQTGHGCPTSRRPHSAHAHLCPQGTHASVRRASMHIAQSFWLARAASDDAPRMRSNACGKRRSITAPAVSEIMLCERTARRAASPSANARFAASTSLSEFSSADFAACEKAHTI